MGIKKPNNKKCTINIDGPSGNAWALMGQATYLAKQMGLNKKKILDDMMSGDYLNLLRVFDKNFGAVVDLETTNEEYIEYVRGGPRCTR